MSKGLVSLDSIFMGTALVSLGFNGVVGGGFRSMEKGIHGSRAFLFSRGFSERYPVSWGMRISIPGVFHISGIL